MPSVLGAWLNTNRANLIVLVVILEACGSWDAAASNRLLGQFHHESHGRLVISSEIVDARAGQIGSIEAGDDLIAAGAHVATHVRVQHRQHHKSKQSHSG